MPVIQDQAGLSVRSLMAIWKWVKFGWPVSLNCSGGRWSIENRTLEKINYELLEESVFYIKADRENALIVSEMVDYKNRIKDKRRSGLYGKFRSDPQPKQVDKVIKEYQPLCGNNKLRISFLVFSWIKEPPRIQKLSKEIREIVSTNVLLVHPIAKWLAKKLQNFKERQSLDVLQHAGSFWVLREIVR